MGNTCKTCTRKVKRGIGYMCLALLDMKYPFERYGKCWAWTDEVGVMKGISEKVRKYESRPKRPIQAWH